MDIIKYIEDKTQKFDPVIYFSRAVICPIPTLAKIAEYILEADADGYKDIKSATAILMAKVKNEDGYKTEIPVYQESSPTKRKVGGADIVSPKHDIVLRVLGDRGTRKGLESLITRIVQDIFGQLLTPLTQLTSSINRFGRFGKTPIIVVSNATPHNKFYQAAIDKINEQWKNNAIKFDTNKPDTKTHFLAFISTLGTINFEIWQENVGDSRDKFNANNGATALGILKAPEAKAVQYSDVQKDFKRHATLTKKKERKQTQTIMGNTSNNYASAMTSPTPRKNKYEWLHRCAHSLAENADVAKNLMCGTDIANTWMIIYEEIVRLALRYGEGDGDTDDGDDEDNKPKVEIECEPLWTDTTKVKYPVFAPPSIKYGIIYNGQYISVCYINILRNDKPSKWINAVILHFYEFMITKKANASKKAKTTP